MLAGLAVWAVHRRSAPAGPDRAASSARQATGTSLGTPARGPVDGAAPSVGAVVPLTSVTVEDLGQLLPKALVGTAAATVGGRILIFGGSGPAGFNATIYAFSPGTNGAGARITADGQLPLALHDAGAAPAGNDVLLCGGGQSVGSTAVYRASPVGGTATLAGRLPQPLSDLEGVESAGRPYCLGGWTGTAYSDAVYDLGGWGGASPPPVTAHLALAVRYSAAVALPGGVLVAGGRTAQGATADVQWVPLGAGARTTAVVGRLARPLEYASGAALDGTALIIGGCDAAGVPTSAVLAVDKRGTVTPVGRLPTGLCYGSAAAVGGAVYLFGGETAGALASDHVWRIVSAPAP